MTAVATLSPTRRSVLFAFADLDDGRPIVNSDVVEALPDEFDPELRGVRYHVDALVEDGLVECVGRVSRDQRGPSPKGYGLTDAGRTALLAEVARRVEQLDDMADPEWWLVVERRESTPDRVVEDSFCSRCGSVYAGDGVCDSCEDAISGDVLADTGGA